MLERAGYCKRVNQLVSEVLYTSSQNTVSYLRLVTISEQQKQSLDNLVIQDIKYFMKTPFVRQSFIIILF